MLHHTYNPIIEIDGHKFRIKKHSAVRMNDGIMYSRIEHLRNLYKWRDIDESRLGEIHSVVVNGERLYNDYEFRIVILGKKPKLHLNRLPDHNHRKKVAKRARIEDRRIKQEMREFEIHRYVNAVEKEMEKYWGREYEAPAALRRESMRIGRLQIMTDNPIYYPD